MSEVDDIVLPNGELNDKKIVKRELLYQGMNGKCVERIYLSSGDSYIYKPITNDSQIGKETWIYEHLLPYIPQIYPRLIAKSSSNEVEENWIIFEDLGTIKHIFNEKIVLQVIEQMVLWHQIPVQCIAKVSLKGPKPLFKKIVSDILSRQLYIIQSLTNLHVPVDHLNRVFRNLGHDDFLNELVFSHGDLHLGNYGIADNRLVVIDWEHAHINALYWDLYHLIDLSHPLFPKNTTNRLRETALDYYVERAQLTGNSLNQHDFKQRYYFFSSVFSIWMTDLIQKDLQKDDGFWPRENLINQLNETITSLLQCLEKLKY